MERFQHAAGLQVDGIVGPQTRGTLHRASAPMLGRGAGYGKPGGSIRSAFFSGSCAAWASGLGPSTGCTVLGPRRPWRVFSVTRARNPTV